MDPPGPPPPPNPPGGPAAGGHGQHGMTGTTTATSASTFSFIGTSNKSSTVLTAVTSSPSFSTSPTATSVALDGTNNAPSSIQAIPSSTLQINLSVNVSVTVQATLPASAVAYSSNTTPLTTATGIAVGISTFLILLLILLLLAFLWFRRKRRREAERDQDSWANSSTRPEVVRRQSTEIPGRDPFLQTTAAPRIPSIVIPSLSPADPFLSTEERAALAGVPPAAAMHQSAPVSPARAPSGRNFHGPTDMAAMTGGFFANGGATSGAKNRNSGGNGNGNAFTNNNRSMWRTSTPLTPPMEVPEEAMQRSPKSYLNPVPPGSPSNVRMWGRPRNQSVVGSGGGREDEDLPDSLGRLNRWLKDKRRRSRI